MLAAAITEVRTCKYFYSGCSKHQNYLAWKLNAVSQKQHRCFGCGVKYDGYGDCIRILRYGNGEVHLFPTTRHGWPVLSLNATMVDETYCEPCLALIGAQFAAVKFPFQTNQEWLAPLTETLPFIPVDLLRIMADYDGYDPKTPPLKRCVTCSMIVV